jgi:hypothetical protein
MPSKWTSIKGAEVMMRGAKNQKHLIRGEKDQTTDGNLGQGSQNKGNKRVYKR